MHAQVSLTLDSPVLSEKSNSQNLFTPNDANKTMPDSQESAPDSLENTLDFLNKTSGTPKVTAIDSTLDFLENESELEKTENQDSAELTLGTPKNTNKTLPATPGSALPVPKSMASLRKDVVKQPLKTAG